MFQKISNVSAEAEEKLLYALKQLFSAAERGESLDVLADAAFQSFDELIEESKRENNHVR